MPCSLFRHAGPDCGCAAVEGEIVPTLHERELYCQGARTVDCPIRRAYRWTGGRIAEERYWAIWLSPVETMSDMVAHSAAPGVQPTTG